MKAPKTIPIQLREEPYLCYSGPIMDKTFEEFVREVGGVLSVALFEGRFKTELFNYLALAQERGKKAYHERLVNEAKDAAKAERKKGK